MIATSGYLTALECTIQYFLSLTKNKVVFLRSVCCNNVFFHSGKQTGIVITTAHYLKHPGG